MSYIMSYIAMHCMHISMHSIHSSIHNILEYILPMCGGFVQYFVTVIVTHTPLPDVSEGHCSAQVDSLVCCAGVMLT